MFLQAYTERPSVTMYHNVGRMLVEVTESQVTISCVSISSLVCPLFLSDRRNSAFSVACW